MNKLFFLFVFILSSFSNTFCTSFLGKGRERKNFDGDEVRKKNGNYTVPFSSAQEMKSTTAEQRRIHPVSPVSRDLLNLSALKEALPGPEDNVAAAGENNNPWRGVNPPSQTPKYKKAKREKREEQGARLALLREQGQFPAPKVLFARSQ